MKIEMCHPSKLKRYPGNPRRNEHAVPVVSASLKEFGWRQPIVVDKDYVIIVGDTRYLGGLDAFGPEKEMPVHIATDLTPAQVIAYRLADNKVGEVSAWDDPKLMIELGLIKDEDFDLAGMGFSPGLLDSFASDVKELMKPDSRILDDFNVMPMPKPHWVVMAIPEDVAADVVAQLRAMNIPGRLEYSAEAGTHKEREAIKVSPKAVKAQGISADAVKSDKVAPKKFVVKPGRSLKVPKLKVPIAAKEVA